MEFFVQFFLFEGVARGAELHFQEPLFAGDGVEEPAFRFFRRADFDDGSVVPIGFADEVVIFLNAVDDIGEDSAIPAAGLAGPPDAIDAVPLSAVGLPRAFWRRDRPR